MKNQKEKSQLFVRIMAGVLAGLMMVGTVGTLVYYLFTM